MAVNKAPAQVCIVERRGGSVERYFAHCAKSVSPNSRNLRDEKPFKNRDPTPKNGDICSSHGRIKARKYGRKPSFTISGYFARPLALHCHVFWVQVRKPELLEEAQRGDLADRGFLEGGGHECKSGGMARPQCPAHRETFGELPDRPQFSGSFPTISVISTIWSWYEKRAPEPISTLSRIC